MLKINGTTFYPQVGGLSESIKDITKTNVSDNGYTTVQIIRKDVLILGVRFYCIPENVYETYMAALDTINEVEINGEERVMILTGITKDVALSSDEQTLWNLEFGLEEL